MNERIKELEKHCWSHRVDGTLVDGQLHFDTQKFAELIVQECVEQLRYTVLNTQELRRDKSTDYQVGWEDGMFDAGEMIKETFRS